MMENNKLLQKIEEAINDAPNMGPHKLTYNVGFQNIRTKSGSILSQTFLNINGLDNIDKTTLTDKFYAKKNPKGGVFYSLKADAPESFLNSDTFNKMYRYLSDTKKYVMPDLDILKAEITQAKFDKVTGEQIKEQNNKFEDLFERIFKSLNDPQTKELLQSISRIGFNINEELYGVVRSPGNVLKVYSIKPNSTFVATRLGWRKFNRILKADATPIILTAPLTTGKDESQAATQLGVQKSDITGNPHKQDAFRLKSTTGIAGFKPVVFFDVSDTIVIPGEEDLFTGQAGLVDNLKGVLNQLAQEEIGVNKVGMESLNISTDEGKNKIFCNKFIKYLSANQGIIPNEQLGRLSKMEPEKDETVVAILRSYFENEFGREHDPNLKTAKVYAAIATSLTIGGLAETERLKILKIHENNLKNILTNRKDFVAISLPVLNIEKLIKDLKESIMNEATATPEFIMKVLGIDPRTIKGESEVTETNEMIEECGNSKIEEEKKKIKENFYNLLPKLYKTK